MGKILTMARREIASYFFSPLAYVVGMLFVAFCGAVFVPLPGSRGEAFILVPGNEASLRPLFLWMALAMVVAVPLLTMRLLSEEYRSGTIEALTTAPITDTQIILGKFLGIFVYYLILLATTLVFLVIMAVLGSPDPGVAAMGYLGMILVGAAYISVGLFASTITRYQLLAAVVGIVILGFFGIVLEQLIPLTPQPWNLLAGKLNTMGYFDDFARGVFDTRGLVFFLSVAAVFLFLSVKSLESRRWQ
jgi:ABC-2 type transport system permease protein